MRSPPALQLESRGFRSIGCWWQGSARETNAAGGEKGFASEGKATPLERARAVAQAAARQQHKSRQHNCRGVSASG